MATTDATIKGTPTQQTTITGISQSDESLSEAAPDPDEFEFVALDKLLTNVNIEVFVDSST